MQIVFLIAGMFIGGLLAWLFLKNKDGENQQSLNLRIAELDKDRSVLADRVQQSVLQNESVRAQNEKERLEFVNLNALLAQQETTNLNLQEKLTMQKQELEQLQQRFTKEFENLANKILEEKSQKFTEQNKNQLDIILNPLKDKIRDFEQKVENVYKVESAERNSLKGEIKSLIELNKQISEEANNLVKALKGDTKKQGNWGELILEKILERSGLVKDEEYKMQVSTQNEQGSRIQPDAVIYLPDSKHIIVDSKVSLIAYEAMINAPDDESREQSLRDHILSVRNHIKGLSEKSYQSSADFTSPDFVLLFMPIESSFGIAVQADNELFNFAWDRKIVIVSPSTLLATLRTISSIWKQERQTRNAMEIARQGGALYDKFKNFVDDLIEVGKKMDGAKSSYSEAMNKLTTGNGNLIKKIEDIRKLGAKATKELPPSLIERAEENIQS
ncbi:MAG: DNA recombination protein RmuC [Bacteroidetes bacterium]|nr:DNA recombination protein RmuC [Bacteroidota bacterium]MBK6838879.1 DNA recombination protein RmuC [Bacteroidota bacterium]MBK9542820.1 DNA recombination protein RmuC [Bacteroidota bacterium]MBP6401084.1 DNA recombination protein RmuC [Bacteroidia bacterium]MBP6648090.1 DNA recombination protein RmuC [Bacteroidia bacterium]